MVVLLGPSGLGQDDDPRRRSPGSSRSRAGEIRIGGRVVAGPGAPEPPDRRDVAVVFQNSALWPHLLGARHRRLPAPAGRRVRLRVARRGAPDPRAVRARRLWPIGVPPSCRAASSSGSGSAGRSPAAPPSTCSTSRRRISTGRSGITSSTEIATARRERAPRAIYATHDTSRRRRSRSPTGWRLIRAGRLVQIGSPARGLRGARRWLGRPDDRPGERARCGRGRGRRRPGRAHVGGVACTGRAPPRATSRTRAGSPPRPARLGDD